MIVVCTESKIKTFKRFDHETDTWKLVGGIKCFHKKWPLVIPCSFLLPILPFINEHKNWCFHLVNVPHNFHKLHLNLLQGYFLNCLVEFISLVVMGIARCECFKPMSRITWLMTSHCLHPFTTCMMSLFFVFWINIWWLHFDQNSINMWTILQPNGLKMNHEVLKSTNMDTIYQCLHQYVICNFHHYVLNMMSCRRVSLEPFLLV